MKRDHGLMQRVMSRRFSLPTYVSSLVDAKMPGVHGRENGNSRSSGSENDGVVRPFVPRGKRCG